MPRKDLTIADAISADGYETTREAEAVPSLLTASAEPIAPPTLSDAFFVLGQALEEALGDNLVQALHANEIQAWYVNGPQNHPAAWRHAVLLLEQALGYDLFTR